MAMATATQAAARRMSTRFGRPAVADAVLAVIVGTICWKFPQELPCKRAATHGARAGGCRADDREGVDTGPRLAREPPNLAHDRRNAGPLPVDEVRAHLCHWCHSRVLEQDAHRLHGRHPAGALPDGGGDLDGYRKVGRAKVHVEGDERLASADGDRAAARVHAERAEVRGASGDAGDLVADGLVLAAAHVREPETLGSQRRGSVEVYGQLEARGDLLAEATREVDALLQSARAQRHKRDHVDGADAGMGAAV